MTSTNIALRGIAVLLTMSGPLSRAVGQRPSTAPVVIANVNVLPLDRDGVLAGRTVVVERGTITRIAGVMLRGQWLSRADLDTILAQLAFR